MLCTGYSDIDGGGIERRCTPHGEGAASFDALSNNNVARRRRGVVFGISGSARLDYRKGGPLSIGECQGTTVIYRHLARNVWALNKDLRRRV